MNAEITLQEGVKAVPRVNILTDVLITKKKSVLFVGEGDFSFTVAFTALRESERPSISWNDIVATCEDGPILRYSEVLAICKWYCKPENRDAIDSMKKSPPPHGSWKSDINAYKLASHAEKLGDHHAQVIWFQCPWGDGKIYRLIRGFLRSAYHKVGNRGYVCIGITTHSEYVKEYELKKLLHEGEDIIEFQAKYHFCGADTTLVENILDFGYHHQGRKDIHDMIKEYHVTLVFRKK